MEKNENSGRSNMRDIARRHTKRYLSRTRIVMILLLIVAIPIFVSLANRAVHENAAAIRQGFGQ